MRRIVLLCAAILIAVSASTAAIVRYRTHARAELKPSVRPAENVPQDPKASKSLFDNAEEGEFGKALWLTVKPTGFEPARVSLPADQYFLLIQNDTGLDRFGLVVQREQGERLHDIRLENRNRKWKQVINFRPGRYIISETDHPDWQCVLTITER